MHTNFKCLVITYEQHLQLYKSNEQYLYLNT